MISLQQKATDLFPSCQLAVKYLKGFYITLYTLILSKCNLLSLDQIAFKASDSCINELLKIT